MQDIPFFKSANPPGGWSDLDILAHNGKETIIAECKTDIVGGLKGKNHDDQAKILEQHFHDAILIMNEKYPFLPKKIRKVLVYEYGTQGKPKISPNFDEKCVEHNIETIHIKRIISELVDVLEKHSREWHPVTRTLLCLKEAGYLNIENTN